MKGKRKSKTAAVDRASTGGAQGSRKHTLRDFRHTELQPNPLNPRLLFDRLPLDRLKESIRENGVLVPLTVYYDAFREKHYIIDGERRWRSAQLIEEETGRVVKIPANIVDPPNDVANLLCMFNIHNLREQWELMPTALALRNLTAKLKTDDENQLHELTKLSIPNIRRCKTLLTFDTKYQELMLAMNPRDRIKANFFIEMDPVLQLHVTLPKSRVPTVTRNKLIDQFLLLHRTRKIKSVTHFRKILLAYDLSKESPRKYQQFLSAYRTLVTSTKHSVTVLFDELAAEQKQQATLETACLKMLEVLRSKSSKHLTASKRVRSLLQETLLELEQVIEKTAE